ncbi:MAG TPA: M15 family metallopeptidase [Steroidobacteraceae bacterium]|jgi:LAS superfamily LD-carboxypeptidase LdcB|nr:M15 family metallopeptidase [Steroidobacteraceae bacterium]
MPILTPEQLTGRVSTHVVEVPQLSCSLHAEAAGAFAAMARQAAQDGIDLAAASSFRPFARQLAIWNAKFHGRTPLLDGDGRVLDAACLDEEQIVRAILLWSALPGASRHHWGTEIDVYDRAALAPPARPQLTPQEYAADGAFAPLSDWLARHGAHYGFFRPYDSDRGGVQPEPWHLSFAPVAGAALPALTLEVLADALRAGELAGQALAGADTVRRLLPQIHERYVCRVAAPGAASRAARPS